MAAKFILVKNGAGYDISDLVTKVVWSGRKNSAARSLKLDLLDDPTLGESNRANVDVYSGNHIIFTEDGSELFRGIIMRQERDQDRLLTITAYDNAIYLANNKDSFNYVKKTLTQIFLDVCKRFGISRGTTAQTTYKIPVIVEVNTTIYDVLCNAMSKTYQATGERFYIISKKGQLHLLRRKEQITKMVLETGSEGSQYGNLTQYSYAKDISDTKTRLKLISEKGKTQAFWTDGNLESKIGIMQDVQIPDDTLKKAKLKTQVIMMLNQLKLPAESLSLTAIGVSTVYSGIAVYVSIPEIGISRTFYVDADTHTWDGDYHSMKLTLNFAKELESISESGETETSTSNDSSATKSAKQAIKDAAAALKKKKAAEKKVISAGNAAEKAANAAESALKNASKSKSSTSISKYVTTCRTQAAKAQAEYEKAKLAVIEAKALQNLSQSTISTSADFAAAQAESAANRAAAALTNIAQYE